MMAEEARSAVALLDVIAFARLGATDHAWALLAARGLDADSDDPAALSILGRLLKDRALAARGAARTRFYQQAADAYARAANLEPAVYPLVNAATLALLAGQPERSRLLAEGILTRIAASPAEGETPYYRQATIAEALLLLGDVAAAERALADAIAHAPTAWEDHASTLRQFDLILAALDVERGWLDRYRPPRSLHFAGHLRLAPSDSALTQRIADLVAEERIGFAWGALAAGADILVAEALVAAGVELNLVLPVPRDRFRDISVAPLGAEWIDRYERLADRAATLRELDAETFSRAALALADMRAMGAAVMHADMLQSEAIQILVSGDDAAIGEGDQTEEAARTWRHAGRRQHRLTARSGTDRVPRRQPADGPIAAWRPRAMIVVDPFSGPAEGGADTSADHDVVMLAATLSRCSGLVGAPCWGSGLLHATFDRPDAAADAIVAIVAGLRGTYRIAAHYGLVRSVGEDPAAVPLGAAVRLPLRMLGSVPDGAAYVTEPFAQALSAIAPPPPGLQWIGELEGGAVGAPISLYVLKPHPMDDA